MIEQEKKLKEIKEKIQNFNNNELRHEIVKIELLKDNCLNVEKIKDLEKIHRLLLLEFNVRGL